MVDAVAPRTLGRMSRTPRSAVIVGAGIVGLSTAWFLRERGVAVTVVDRSAPAAGASWGNAGWLSPGKAVPLGEPSVLRTSVTSLFDADAALRIPPRADPGLWAFLVRFALRCTRRQWTRGVRALNALNGPSVETFDELADGGVDGPMRTTSVVAGFGDAQAGEAMCDELAGLSGLGGGLDFERITRERARELAPQIGERTKYLLEFPRQRIIEPSDYIDALAKAVTERGGVIRGGFTVHNLRHQHGKVFVDGYGVEPVAADAVVIATGAWLSSLARAVGVRTRVQAGRGYSFTVSTEEPATVPIFLPATRAVATPSHGRLRLAGTMEFLPPDAPMDTRRIDAIQRAVSPWLTGVTWADRADEWVGPRPLTPDGLPLIGATRAPGVFVAGGHGMWGATQGPITGKLLAEQIVTGQAPPDLHPFDPLR